MNTPSSQARTFVNALDAARPAPRHDSRPWRLADFPHQDAFTQHDQVQAWVTALLREQPDPQSLGSEAFTAADQQLRQVIQEHGGQFHPKHPELLVFRDRSAALRLTPPQGLQYKVGAHLVYRDLEWWEAEQYIYTHGPQARRDLFLGQLTLHPDSAYFYRREARRVIEAAARSSDTLLRGALHPRYDAVRIHGIVRNLVQVSALVDARTIAEVEADEQAVQWWNSLSAEEQKRELDQVAPGGFPEADGEMRALTLEDLDQLDVEARRDDLRRLQGRTARPELVDNGYLWVECWLAFVQVPRAYGERVEQVESYLIHPLLTPENNYLNHSLLELARIKRGGKAYRDQRDWFAGRKAPFDPGQEEMS